MDDARALAAVLADLGETLRAGNPLTPKIKLSPSARRSTSTAVAKSFHVDPTWIPVLRAPFIRQEMAKLGPFGISTLIAIKARSHLQTGESAVSIRSIADDVGISERAARKAVRRLETEGLVEPIREPGRMTRFQIIERLQIVNSEGVPIGVADWPFCPADWLQIYRKLVGLINQLNEGRSQQIDINIGTINVVIAPGGGP